MFLAIDTHSDAYLDGQLVGAGTVGLVAGLLVWTLTRSWRNPVARTMEDAPRVAALRARRRAVVSVGILLFVAAAVAVPAVSATSGAPYGPAARSGPTGRTVEGPATVAGYQLITGDAADQLSARVRGSAEHYWFYSATADGTRPDVVLAVSTTAWDPRFAQENAAHSLSWGLANYFAGAKVDDPEDVDPGPLGGVMQCGRQSSTGIVVCRWADASTAGSVMAPAVKDLHQAAVLALQVRTAAEQ
ncbi:hypothetical protein [Kitasatospora sp. NPDC097691]|uniref:hypothetical protein n=1 Tax=Kitasatospora sp. NPDC097691 TaxID=3157231 RepID=UPI00331D956C